MTAWNTPNCEEIATKVVSHWSQSDMVAICENYVFEQLQDSEDYFHTIVYGLKEKENKIKWNIENCARLAYIIANEMDIEALISMAAETIDQTIGNNQQSFNSEIAEREIKTVEELKKLAGEKVQ